MSFIRGICESSFLWTFILYAEAIRMGKWTPVQILIKLTHIKVSPHYGGWLSGK